jgi:hypothetical protein
VNPADAETLMLMTAHMLALGVACAIFVGMIVLHRRAQKLNQSLRTLPKSLRLQSKSRPNIWLAVRSLEPETVRLALLGRGKFLVNPRVNGWVIVTGPDLPSPSDDVDACFRFLVSASRQLGHVQFFYADKFSAHHAWARMDDGCVTRAYAWAGETIWNQGAKTMAEAGLGMKCFGYGEDSEMDLAIINESAAANVEKIPLLAARWSIDPAMVRRESPRFY